MRLEWLRTKKELSDVLHTPRAPGPEIAYWIFGDLTEHTWKNMTVLAPGLYGKEFPKTFGHYHTHHVLETYKLVSGDGIFLLQKKHYENNKFIHDEVKEVYLVKFTKGEELVVPYEFGHAWCNVGDTPLITFDDWDSGHVPTDYEVMKKLHGMCFYILNDNGLKFIPNPHYTKHPEPKIVTVKEFQRLYPVR